MRSKQCMQYVLTLFSCLLLPLQQSFLNEGFDRLQSVGTFSPFTPVLLSLSSKSEKELGLFSFLGFKRSRLRLCKIPVTDHVANNM